MSLEPALVVPAAILAVAAVVDLRSREIPDALPVLLIVWAVSARLLGAPLPGWGAAVLGLGTGLALGVPAFAFGVLGGGDVKLLGGLGAVLGPLALLVVAAWIGLFGGLLALVARIRKDPELAYGPAICLGYVGAIWIG